MNINSLPKELRLAIDNEQPDFIVRSKRNYPKTKAYGLLAFALFWNGFISIFWVAFFGPLFQGKEVHFTSNDVPQIATVDDWSALIMPGLIIGLFSLVGLGLFFYGLIMLYQTGAYFVGTPTGLIKFRKGNLKRTDWEQFSGNTKMKNNGLYGNLEFELRTGKTQSRSKGPAQFVPDIIHLSEIENVFNVEKKCRIRIKENDPTPALV